MRSRCLGVALAIITISLSTGMAFAQPQPAIGVVVSARSGQIGAASAAPGTTVFSGDRLVTQKDSGLIIRSGDVQFSFQDETVAALYARPDGIALDIERGSLTFFSQVSVPGFTLFVSDLRITPSLAQAFSGEVTVVSPCEAILTARVNHLRLLSGRRTGELTAGTSVQVVPENPIETRPPGLPPGDSSFHRGHAHKGCRPPAGPGQSAKTAGPNWLAPVLFVEAGVVTAVVLARPVSPH